MTNQKEYMQVWRAENRERIKEYARRPEQKQKSREYHRKHRLRGALNGAKERCRNPNHASYKNYGGRGIEYRLPESPKETAQLLIEVLGPRPEGYQLDRIDNNGHYEIGNLRWSSRSDNSRNTRRASCPECGEGIFRSGKRYRVSRSYASLHEAMAVRDYLYKGGPT